MLARTTPGASGFDIQTFECPACHHVHQRVVERGDPMKSRATGGGSAANCDRQRKRKRTETEDQMSTESQLAADALDTPHGARELPSKEAAAELGDFLNSISSSIHDSPRLAAASAALQDVVHKLEVDGSASDDDWLSAIDTMHSLANETFGP
jgi:hypothetical protein